MNLLRRAAKRYAAIIAATLNGPWRDGGGLVGAIIDLNFGADVDPRLYPKLVPTGLEPNALAEALGSLPALVDKGFVKINNFRRNTNKLGYAYLLTPSGIEAKARLTRAFLLRKQDEYDALRAEILRLQQEIDMAEG